MQRPLTDLMFFFFLEEFGQSFRNDVITPALFTAVGQSLGSVCSTLRLGDEKNRQTIEYNFWLNIYILICGAYAD